MEDSEAPDPSRSERAAGESDHDLPVIALAVSAEWRTASSGDTILVVGEDALVRAACPASVPVLRKFLTDLGDLQHLVADQSVENKLRPPEAWGELVISRAFSGEVLILDPEL